MGIPGGHGVHGKGVFEGVGHWRHEEGVLESGFKEQRCADLSGRLGFQLVNMFEHKSEWGPEMMVSGEGRDYFCVAGIVKTSIRC